MRRLIRPIGLAGAALAVGAFLSGCAAVPADPYYGGYGGYGTAAYPVEPAVGGVAPYPYYYGPGVIAAPVSIGIVGSFGHSHRGGWGPRPGYGPPGWGPRYGPRW